jgi:hypothetical protein
VMMMMMMMLTVIDSRTALFGTEQYSRRPVQPVDRSAIRQMLEARWILESWHVQSALFLFPCHAYGEAFLVKNGHLRSTMCGWMYVVWRMGCAPVRRFRRRRPGGCGTTSARAAVPSVFPLLSCPLHIAHFPSSTVYYTACCVIAVLCAHLQWWTQNGWTVRTVLRSGAMTNPPPFLLSIVHVSLMDRRSNTCIGPHRRTDLDAACKSGRQSTPSLSSFSTTSCSIFCLLSRIHLVLIQGPIINVGVIRLGGRFSPLLHSPFRLLVCEMCLLTIPHTPLHPLAAFSFTESNNNEEEKGWMGQSSCLPPVRHMEGGRLVLLLQAGGCVLVARTPDAKSSQPRLLPRRVNLSRHLSYFTTKPLVGQSIGRYWPPGMRFYA